jgi:GMP synthase-like glutamine amidotransferase
MADTFGGKAEKTIGGNVVGVRQYDLNGTKVDTHVWHQDQVTQVPPNAKVTGTADYCPVGALEYDFPAASVQFHPEHTLKHISDVFERARGEAGFPTDADMAAALASFEVGDVKADLMTEKVAVFFRANTTNV